MSKVYLGLGSNLGDRQATLEGAIEALLGLKESGLLAVSPLYETPPWGPVEQPPFLNAVVAMDTQLTPEALLTSCQAIEATFQRKRQVHWGPRTLDIDILWIEGFESSDPHLTVPHPRITERAFVLVPLADLAPQLIIGQKSVREWLQTVDREEVKEWTRQKEGQR